MKSYRSEIKLAREITKEALIALERERIKPIDYKFDKEFSKELKSTTDKILEKIILKRLLPTGIPVLSEESCSPKEKKSQQPHWVVDPLDGTVNFIRNNGPCAVSIALCKKQIPIFGVVGEYPTGKITWGGPSYASFAENKPLQVSKIKNPRKGILCTGFPSRFDFRLSEINGFARQAAKFGKVRMIGAASLSLLMVAKGAAEAYAEKDIMIWDVAAGLAIVLGAGGKVRTRPGRFDNSLNVQATNGLLPTNLVI